jgi:hypothetical protein
MAEPRMMVVLYHKGEAMTRFWHDRSKIVEKAQQLLGTYNAYYDRDWKWEDCTFTVEDNNNKATLK